MLAKADYMDGGGQASATKGNGEPPPFTPLLDACMPISVFPHESSVEAVPDQSKGQEPKSARTKRGLVRRNQEEWENLPQKMRAKKRLMMLAR